MHSYSLLRHPHGWLVCAPPGEDMIPIDATQEVLRLFPAKKAARLDPGIAHHYNASDHTLHVVLAVCPSLAAADRWRGDIAVDIAHLSTEVRWWRGTDVGCSSAALFSVLTGSAGLAQASDRMGQGRTPRDADDFGRCRRMVQLLDCRHRLPVACLRLSPTWQAIITQWDFFCALSEPACTAELQKLHTEVHGS